ncbi:MAG: twin-arginine translocation signal domain-containing protein [Selenomonadaceae bacterium]|nr:twin-arginine translocation signal domain-containing protein [Selenomonadaceae bacterium]MBQ9496270.1 twin-arginine translocation signal domain-containing protein [Selenomonadaceae bacterium]
MNRRTFIKLSAMSVAALMTDCGVDEENFL